jgi:hypothetical protein
LVEGSGLVEGSEVREDRQRQRGERASEGNGVRAGLKEKAKSTKKEANYICDGLVARSPLNAAVAC